MIFKKILTCSMFVPVERRCFLFLTRLTFLRRLPVPRPPEHTASVKDLKTRVITPAKHAGTPQKGLLKVGGGGSVTKPVRPTAGRKETPHSKRAAHFF